MTHLRLEALKQLSCGVTTPPKAAYEKISSLFAEDAFTMPKMRAALPPEVYEKISEAIRKRKKIDKETANAVASAVKTWAISKNVTHFTHWFQPLTGGTAEKHDSFFDAQSGIEKFKGDELVQQESDASSFPSGGIRSTFEARGYTAWDPTSPMFIYGRTLCIPTVFVSYTGEALDTKSPLLRALKAIDRAATNVCRLFNSDVNHVTAYLGCEQEYFVVEKALYNARPDLVITGRTVLGHAPARGQQLENHYFGAIPSRVYHFMRDFEVECWRLGIPLRTRHNEVAPGQYEVAPLFEEVNIANDHNQLTMDIMRRVADRHMLKVLFHEKPFHGLNGSGKHNNWSLITDRGVNLFAPSSSARENLLFLTFLVVTIRAVFEHADLLRASIATPANDLRLGAHEAPPSIISVFLGAQMNAVLDELEKNGNVSIKKGENMYMKLGIDQIPEIILDATDRNRTSPFAFTGNKFEFRAVGSSDNCATAMTALNLIVADQLTHFLEAVQQEITQGVEKRMAIVTTLRQYTQESRAIRFEGDGYAESWVKEAARRGLSNIDNMPRAIGAYLSNKSVQLFERLNILSRKELEARQKIKLIHYINETDIEAKVIVEMVESHIVPTAIAYQNRLLRNADGLQRLGLDQANTIFFIKKISRCIEQLTQQVGAMKAAQEAADQVEDVSRRAIAYCDQVRKKHFTSIRRHADELEMLIDDKDWPLVKYRELLFSN